MQELASLEQYPEIGELPESNLHKQSLSAVFRTARYRRIRLVNMNEIDILCNVDDFYLSNKTTTLKISSKISIPKNQVYLLVGEKCLSRYKW